MGLIHAPTGSEIVRAEVFSTPLAIDSRIATFDAAADMPADITVAGNVTNDRIKFTGFTTTSRKLLIQWHAPDATYQGTAGAGPVAMGALLTVNALDDSTADARLTQTDLTGNGTSSSGVADLFMVSATNPSIELTTSATIDRVDAIGVPNKAAPTTILPSYLTITALG